MLVSHILNEKGRQVLAIPGQASLFEAARVLHANRIGALVVLTPQGGLAGLISDRDIVRALAEDGAAALSLTVSARMTTDVATCEEADTLADVMETMTSCRFRHMPVVEDRGLVVGIVSTGDVLKTRIAETIREAQALKEYIAAN